MFSSLKRGALLAAFCVYLSSAQTQQSHTVSLANYCGFGTPTLLALSDVYFYTTTVIAKGNQTYDNNTVDAVAWLDTGNTTVQTSTTVDLHLGTQDGNFVPQDGSSVAVINLSKFTTSASISYYNGCDGISAACLSNDCPGASRPAQLVNWITCPANATNSNTASMLVTFCPELNPAAPANLTATPSSTVSVNTSIPPSLSFSTTFQAVTNNPQAAAGTSSTPSPSSGSASSAALQERISRVVVLMALALFALA